MTTIETPIDLPAGAGDHSDTAGPAPQGSGATRSQEAGLAREFAVDNGDYYARQFAVLGEARNYAFTFNRAAALLGPMWLAARGLWGPFWAFLLAETIALVQFSRGLWGEHGVEHLERAARLSQRALERSEQAGIALAEGATTKAEVLRRSAESFTRGAEEAQALADAAVSQGPLLLAFGLGLLVLIKFIQGATGNWLLERQFIRWRSSRQPSGGLNRISAAGGAAMMALIYPLAAYRFSVAAPPQWLTEFPADKSWHSAVSGWIDDLFELMTVHGEGLFDAIRNAIHGLLEGLETVLVDTPWPIVMLVIIVLAWRLAGVRVAIFTMAALAYLALLGFWEKSMATVALLGTASFLCILLGIPLGIWCARNRKAYAVVRPILDFMQTMPAFVYLIPVIAFFGTGKPPGIIATLVFGMPPVVRLTALGMQGVPHTVREAATAFGASKQFLLLRVDLPLALPSIMAGINQTILMCLSMVVIASLIGAKGLGEDVLEALQYAAQGQGIVAGLAILFCAMVLDRIVQGKNSTSASSH